jgi:hypothetical protein
MEKKIVPTPKYSLLEYFGVGKQSGSLFLLFLGFTACLVDFSNGAWFKGTIATAGSFIRPRYSCKKIMV